MRQRPALVPALLALSLVAAACGVPRDAQPRAIDPGNVPFSLLEPEPSTPGTLLAGPETVVPATVYLVGAEGRLVATVRQVRAPLTLPRVVDALLVGVTDDDAAHRLSSAIAPGTKLRGLDGPTDGLLTVDLSDDVLDVTGRRQIEAIAQVLFTATEFDGVERILFEFDGQRHDVPRGDGELTSSPLTRRDFRRLGPPPPPTTTTTNLHD